MSRRWLLPQANPDVIRFTVTPTASAKTVTLENLTAPCNCFIDWGDGERSAQIVSATSISHDYADTTPRQITIHGVLGGFWNSAAISVGKTLVTSVDEINSVPWSRWRTHSEAVRRWRRCPQPSTRRTLWISATPFTSAAASRQLCPRCGSRIRALGMPRVLRIASSRFMDSMGQVVHRVSMCRPSPGRHTIRNTDKAVARRQQSIRQVKKHTISSTVGRRRVPGT